MPPLPRVPGISWGDPCPYATGNTEATQRCMSWRDECETKGCRRVKYQREEAAREARKYRNFPGKPRGPNAAKQGYCRWCDQIIVDPKTGQASKRRGWHDGRGEERSCSWEYSLHTRSEDQLHFLLGRDGAYCSECRGWMGIWSRGYAYTPEKVAKWGGWTARHYPADTYVGPFTSAHLGAKLQVDHILCLALVVLTIPEAQRWRYWGPSNLQGLCHDCHVKKTQLDRAAIKAARTDAG